MARGLQLLGSFQFLINVPVLVLLLKDVPMFVCLLVAVSAVDGPEGLRCAACTARGYSCTTSMSAPAAIGLKVAVVVLTLAVLHWMFLRTWFGTWQRADPSQSTRSYGEASPSARACCRCHPRDALVYASFLLVLALPIGYTASVDPDVRKFYDLSDSEWISIVVACALMSLPVLSAGGLFVMGLCMHTFHGGTVSNLISGVCGPDCAVSAVVLTR